MKLVSGTDGNIRERISSCFKEEPKSYFEITQSEFSHDLSDEQNIWRHEKFVKS